MNRTKEIVTQYRLSLWNVIELIASLCKKFDVTSATKQTGMSYGFIRWSIDISKVGIYKKLNPNFIYELYPLDAKTRCIFIKRITQNKYETLRELKLAIRNYKSEYDNSINNKGYSLKRQLDNKKEFFNKRKEYNTYVE